MAAAIGPHRLHASLRGAQAFTGAIDLVEETFERHAARASQPELAIAVRASRVEHTLGR